MDRLIVYPPSSSDSEGRNSPGMSQQEDNAGPSHTASLPTEQPQASGGEPTESSSAAAESSFTRPTQSNTTDEPPAEPSAGPSQSTAAEVVTQSVSAPDEPSQPATATGTRSGSSPEEQPDPSASASRNAASGEVQGTTSATVANGLSLNESNLRRKQLQTGSLEAQRARRPRRDPPQPRGRTPPINAAFIGIPGGRGGLMPAPRAKEKPQVYRGVLPNYMHPRPIEAGKIPLCSLFRRSLGVLYPHLDEFLQRVLDQAFEAINQNVPSDAPDSPYPRPRRSPGCKPKCYFSHRTIMRGFDAAWAEDIHEPQVIIPEDAREEWFGRRSVHKDSRRRKRATFADMRNYWKDRHTIHLPEYLSGTTVDRVHKYDCEDIKLVNWRDVTAEICWIQRSNGLLSSHRVFAVLVITAARAFDPATLDRSPSQLPRYEETADSQPGPIPRPNTAQNQGQNPEQNPEQNPDVPPTGEPGSSRDIEPVPAEAGSSRDVEPVPAEAESSRDVQPAPAQAGSSSGVEPEPIGPTPARGVPDGWLDSLVVVHLPLDHRSIPEGPREHRFKRTIFPSYVSVGMVKQLPQTAEEERDKKAGKYEWSVVLSAKPQSRMPLRLQKNLYFGIPHLIKDEPGEFMRMLDWRRYNDCARRKSLVRFI